VTIVAISAPPFWVICVAATFLLSGCYHTVAYDTNVEAYDATLKGDHEKAVSLLRIGAKEGYSGSEFDLGRKYQKGDGVPQSYQLPLHWYSMAADQGHSTAMNNIGYLIAKGFGTEKNHAKALGWYLRAAQNASNIAFSNIGRYYRKGILPGTPQNYVEAYYWYSLAFKFGFSKAKSYLDIIEWRVDENDRERVKRRVANFRPSILDQLRKDLKGVYEEPSSASFRQRDIAPKQENLDRTTNSKTPSPSSNGLASTVRPTGTSNAIESQLLKLKSLFEKNLISEDEYKDAKARLLGKL
jgi:hypothetical protein